MRALFLLPLLLNVNDVRLERISRIDRLRPGSVAPAFFEFAPATGAGMTAACACTNPTGSKGEVMTFSRASSGVCMKGNMTSGIANGDMVTCTNNQARVMPGGDGTGVNGLFSEGPRTNTILRSQEIDNVAWSTNAGIVAAPVITADQAVAPDGNTTAERIQCASCGATASCYCQIYQVALTPSVANSCSMYVKGNGTSGTLGARMVDSAPHGFGCSYNSTTWTRCNLTVTLDATASPLLSFGVFSTATYPATGSDGAAFDGFVWGVQCEAAGSTSSYIATAGATATRATDVSRFSVTIPAGTGSVAATATATSVFAVEQSIVAISEVGPTYTALPLPRSAAAVVTLYATAGGVSTAGIHWTANTEYRIAGFWTGSGTDATICDNGICSAGGPLTINASTLVEIGIYSGANSPTFGVVKKVCVDPNPSKCR